MTKRKHYRPITEEANRPNTRPHYLKILEKAYQAGFFPPGSVGEIEIQHDNDCAIFKGGACNCDPTVIHKEVKP